MSLHKTFFSQIQATQENIDKHVDGNENLYNFFKKECPEVKKVLIQEIWNRTIDTSFLNKTAQHMIRHISKTRLSSIAEYNKETYSYSWNHNDKELKDQFNSSKLHWLINDIKIAGLGYPPQGFMQDDMYVCHPGTYRYYAAFAQQTPIEVSVWDTHKKLPGEGMDLKEWISFCSNGFIRKNRTITLESDSVEPENRAFNGKRHLEINETSNHHDHCIFNNDLHLAEMYNYDKPTIYAPNMDIIDAIKSKLDDYNLFKFDITTNKFLIPSMQDFKGVGIYIERAGDIGKDPSHCLLYLDTNDDIATFNNKITIFNCSTPNCKKLIPEIVNESTEIYLNKYLWCSKVSHIPQQIGEHL